MTHIPTYRAVIDDDTEGFVRMSFVDYPAVESNWIMMAQEQEKAPLLFGVDEEKQILRGVVLRANYPIYRTGDGITMPREYYIIFERDVIRQFIEGWLNRRDVDAVDLQHNGREVAGAQLVNVYCIDRTNGIDPIQFRDIEDGSAIAEYHITDTALWGELKRGNYNGYSIEGIFSLLPIPIEEQKTIIKKTKRMGIKEALLRILLEDVKIETEEGIVFYVSDIEEGAEVLPEDGKEPIPDGVYHAEGLVITIKDGKIESITDDEEAVTPEEAPVEAPAEAPAEVPGIEELRAQLAELTTAINDVREQLADHTIRLTALTEYFRPKSKLNKDLRASHTPTGATIIDVAKSINNK